MFVCFFLSVACGCFYNGGNGLKLLTLIIDIFFKEMDDKHKISNQKTDQFMSMQTKGSSEFFKKQNSSSFVEGVFKQKKELERALILIVKE